MSYSEMSYSRNIGIKTLVASGAALALLLAAGCGNQPSNQQIQQQAAQTTQQVKQDAQQAAADTRVAAGKAEEKIDAVAAGVKQGLQGGPSATVVDLNSANNDQLIALPGISAGKARKIVAGRPYSNPNDLVARNLLTQSQFDRISGRVVAQ